MMKRGVLHMALACVALLTPFAASGSTAVSVMMGLGETEWRVHARARLPPFPAEIRRFNGAIQAEAPDAAKKASSHASRATHGSRCGHAGSPLVGSTAQCRLSWRICLFAPGRPSLTRSMPHLVDVGTFEGALYFMPYRPNVQIAYYQAEEVRSLWAPSAADLGRAAGGGQKVSGQRRGLECVLVQGTQWTRVPPAQVFEFIWAAGGDPLVLNDPGSVQAFTFLQQLAPNSGS